MLKVVECNEFSDNPEVMFEGIKEDCVSYIRARSKFVFTNYEGYCETEGFGCNEMEVYFNNLEYSWEIYPLAAEV